MAKLSTDALHVGQEQNVNFGNSDDYHFYEEPSTGRLVIEDTANGTKAYIRPDDSGQLGNTGSFLRALTNGEPLADDGHTYSTVQAAENAANGWVFVPPGSFNEEVTINTDDITIVGAGTDSEIDGSGLGTLTNGVVNIDASGVTLRDLAVTIGTNSGDLITGISGSRTTLDSLYGHDTPSNSGDGQGFLIGLPETIAINNTLENINGGNGIYTGPRGIAHGNNIDTTWFAGINPNGDNTIITNNIITNPCQAGPVIAGIEIRDQNCLVGGNRIHNSGYDGIGIDNGTTTLLFNNRVSDSANNDIADNGTETVVDANFAGTAN